MKHGNYYIIAGPGVYYGKLDLTVSVDAYSVTKDPKLVPYPREGDERPQSPMAMVLTEFHVLLLYPDR